MRLVKVKPKNAKCKTFLPNIRSTLPKPKFPLVLITKVHYLNKLPSLSLKLGFG